MFTVSDAQMSDISDTQDDEYAKHLAVFMRETAPDLGVDLDDAALYDTVRAAVREGRKKGVLTPEGMVAVATLWIIAEPEMFSEPGVIAYFEMPSETWTIDTKMIRLVEQIQSDLTAEEAAP